MEPGDRGKWRLITCNAPDQRSHLRVFPFLFARRLYRAQTQVIALLKVPVSTWWDGRLEGGENSWRTTETTLESRRFVVVLW